MLAQSAKVFRQRPQAKLCVHALRTRTYASIQPNTFGQAHPATHPHLLKSSDELTPGITKLEYHERRKRLMDSLPAGSVVVLRAGNVKYMSKNIFYRFRQSSDFWYLTGFEEPQATVVLEKDASPKGYRMTFFCAPNDARKELWDGPVAGISGAKETFGADEAFENYTLLDKLPLILSSSSRIYTDFLDSVPSVIKTTRKNLMSYLNPSSSYIPPPPKPSYMRGASSTADFEAMLYHYGAGKAKQASKEIFKFRRIKSEAERRLMKGAAVRSARAHAMTMQFARPGLSEADIEAHFQYACALSYDAVDGLGSGGCQRPAYVPVVASGRNALTIHYTTNNQMVREGELILIDGGGEWNGYASDITRTFPATGKFTEPQRLLYQAVLNVQKKCISLLCTGSAGPTSISEQLKGGEMTRLTLPNLHRISTQFLTEELVKIGFKFEPYSADVERHLYPHLVGHGVGIDLHESSGSRDEELVEGQVITIEPGVYVPEDSRYPKEFHNIGIRIEDEVLIEKDHGVVLSASAPKEIVDIEATCQGSIEIR
ncbi:hypothetical protein CPB86DRAFT_563159 [Serendipita vermifera]|nr:hypothetical protein CPB86DRAFT_563159 [Serendipita vermifera]